ncbi:virulence factor Mce [Pseudonocardia sp. TMWB2A]|uniref:MlaD family protein n=1 Tax=Pseudonocardia sp. TMWB2A TaxID=687430 RepID=UPI00307DD2D1
MITRYVKVQIAIFAVLTLIATLLIVFYYVRVPQVLGIGRIAVTATLPAAGGLYPNANVTYRGVTVGTVTDVDLDPEGVRIRMTLDKDHLPPTGSRAEVHSVSAIGEQFVDFVPQDPAAAPMADGDHVPLALTSIPTPTAQVLQGTDNLLTSVDQQNFTTVLTEFADAFRDLGPDLGRLIDNTGSLVGEAGEERNFAATEGLINDFEGFADPQLATSDSIRNWGRNLASFTGQLRESDPALRSVLTDGNRAAQQADSLLTDLGRSTPPLLSTTEVLTRLAEAYHAPIEQILVVYPMFTAASLVVAPESEPGIFRFNLETNVNQPNCVEGWIPAGQPGGPRNAMETGDVPLPANSYCKLPQDDPTLARSARNLPCFEPGSPPGRRAATIFECRGSGFSPTAAGRLTLRPETPLNNQPAFEPLGGIGAVSSPATPSERMTLEGLMTPSPAGAPS